MLPLRCGGVPPVDLVSRQIRVVHRLPSQNGGGTIGAADLDDPRLGRGPGQRGQGGGVHAGDLPDIVEVHALDHVSVLDAVLDPDVLVLPIVVLVGLHDADAGEAHVVEGTVMPSPPEAIEAVDHDRVEVGDVEIGDLVHVAGDLAGRPVHLASEGPPALVIRQLVGGRVGLGEDPEGGVLDDPVDPLHISDHVVVQDGCDVPLLLDSHLCHVSAPDQPLLLG